MQVKVNSENVKYSDEFITATYEYDTTTVVKQNDTFLATPKRTKLTLQTKTKLPKVG